MYQKITVPIEYKLRYGLENFWISTGKQQNPIQFSIHPDGNADIILEISNFDKRIKNIWLTGFENQSRKIILEPDSIFLGMQFHPGGLSDLPISEVGNQSIDLRQIHKGLSNCIEKSFSKWGYAGGLLPIFHVIQNFTGEADADVLATSLFLRGGVMAKKLTIFAKNRNISVRTIERKFKNRTGLVPQEYSRIMRFHNARNIAKGINSVGEPISLANIALEAGYCDQSHLNREVKRITGMTPAIFFQ